MPRKPRKNWVTAAIDNLKEALQIQPARQAVDRYDKRSAKRGKRLIKDLEKKFRPSEIADEMGISTQKYTAIKKAIRKNKVASSTLNDLLEATAEGVRKNSGRPQDMRSDYIADKPVNGRRKFKIDYVEMSQDYIEKNMKWATNIKPGGFASKQSALNWYGGVTGGKEYFSIVRGRNGRFFIYDTRTASEKSKYKKGQVSGNTKASRLMERDNIKQ